LLTTVSKLSLVNQQISSNNFEQIDKLIFDCAESNCFEHSFIAFLKDPILFNFLVFDEDDYEEIYWIGGIRLYQKSKLFNLEIDAAKRVFNEYVNLYPFRVEVMPGNFRLLRHLVADRKFDCLIFKVLLWLQWSDIDCITLEIQSHIIDLNVRGGGLIKWDVFQNVKTPKSIYLNIKDFQGLELLYALLHKCGHAMDRNRTDIYLKSKESEISAWRNAIILLSSVALSKEEKGLLIDIVTYCLYSYDVDREDINSLVARV
jgi:hypothetical protein